MGQIRVALAFKRFKGWQSQTPMVQNKITDLDEINKHMNKVGVNVKPYPVKKRIVDSAVSGKIIAGTATHEDVLNALNVSSKEEWIKTIEDGKREPMHELSDLVLATSEENVPPYPKIYDLGQSDQKTKAFLVNKFARLHFNFWQGGDMSGVDPNMSPITVDERMVLLPRPEQDDIPWFWFFYLGDGVVAKLVLEPGTEVGIEMSYPGIWPHGAAFLAMKGMCHAQISCGNPVWHLRYDMDYMHSDSTEKAYKKNHNGIYPDYRRVLGQNPWCDFSDFKEGQDIVPRILED